MKFMRIGLNRNGFAIRNGLLWSEEETNNQFGREGGRSAMKFPSYFRHL